MKKKVEEVKKEPVKKVTKPLVGSNGTSKNAKEKQGRWIMADKPVEPVLAHYIYEVKLHGVTLEFTQFADQAKSLFNKLPVRGREAFRLDRYTGIKQPVVFQQALKVTV